MEKKGGGAKLTNSRRTKCTICSRKFFFLGRVLRRFAADWKRRGERGATAPVVAKKKQIPGIEEEEERKKILGGTRSHDLISSGYEFVANFSFHSRRDNDVYLTIDSVFFPPFLSSVTRGTLFSESWASVSVLPLKRSFRRKVVDTQCRGSNSNS